MADAHGSSSRDHRVSLISNILAIAGLIILVIVILWGFLHLVSLGSGWFSSLFGSNKSIVVSVPAETTSGTPFNLSWQYSPSQSGSYALLYECKSGLTYYTPVNGKFAEINCGGAYTLGAATSSATLLPTLSASSSVSSTLTLVYIPSTKSTAANPQGSATTIVVPQVTSKPTVTTKTYSAPKPAASAIYKGPADLVVTILSSNVDPYGNATVSFDVANLGSGTSGVYYFSATLPTVNGYTYTSPAQSPLIAGSHISSTLNFTQAVPGSFIVSLSGGDDVNGANNFASQYIGGTYNPANYQNQPIYTPSPQPYYQPTYGGDTQCYWNGGNQVCYQTTNTSNMGLCYYNGATYVCNQPSSYSNGLPYYINSGQYPYTATPYYNY